MIQRMRSLYPHSFRFPIICSLALLSLLGRIDTAQAQQGQVSFTVSPSSIPFVSTVGGPFQSIPVQVNSTPTSAGYTVTSHITGAVPNWLGASTTSTSTPGQVNVTATPGNLAIGTYNGEVDITSLDGVTVYARIGVSLQVASTTAITVSPSALSFNATVGSTTPATQQTLAVNSATNGIGFTVGSVPTWLTVSPTSGNTNANLTVTANPTGLAVGVYTAPITITPTQGSPQSSTVTFTIGGQPTLSSNIPASPGISLLYQIGQNQLFDSTAGLQITSGSVPVSISAILTQSGANPAACNNVLGMTPVGTPSFPALLTTPANITVFASGLANITQPVTCAAIISVTSPSTANTLSIPVSLTVSNNPLVIVTPNPAPAFAYQVGGVVPATQYLTFASSMSGLQFSASSNVPWLTATPTGVSSSSPQIALVPQLSALQALLPQSTPYTGSITVTTPSAANPTVTIPVSVTVSTNSLLTFNPPSAAFVYEMGQPQNLNTQSIQISSTGAQIPFVISIPTTTGTSFVTVTPSCTAIAPCTTPTNVTVAANPAGLPTGISTASVNFTPTTSGAQTQLFPVTLSVSSAGQPQLSASPQILNFTLAQGQGPTTPSQSIVLSSTDSNPLNITNISSSNTWIVPSATSGSTILNLGVHIDATNLVPQTAAYIGTIMITATNPVSGVSTVTTIPVSFVYNSGVTLTASPASLSFTQVVNGAIPSAQTVSIGAAGITGANLAFSATVSAPWLTVTPNTPASGTAPATISLSLTSAAATLAPGSYSGSVQIYGANAANPNQVLNVPVTLTVVAAPTLTFAPAGLTFSGTVNGTNPTSQTVSITAPNAINSVTFMTAVSTSSGSWLSVTGPGTTPSTLTVSVNLNGLGAGSYTGTITLTPSGGGAPSSIPVSLTVGAQLVPTLTSMINAASGALGNASPGELVSIFGTGLGPIAPAGLTLNAQGSVSTTLSGVSVSFNGIAAPLTYVSSTQINAIVPFEMSGVTTAQLTISYNGAVSSATAITIQATTPGIFTQNSSGTGLGAILKPDYSTVTASNAAPRGSTIIIYATGGGLTTPGSITGAVAPSTTLLKTNANVTVIIGGVAATVSYAGSAPGLVEGVLQVNAIVPAGISAGNQPILVTVGNFTSQNGVTVPVQ